MGVGEGPWDSHLFEQLIQHKYGSVAEAARQLGLSQAGLRTFLPPRGPQNADVRKRVQRAFPEHSEALWGGPAKRAADPDLARLEAKVDALLAAVTRDD